MAIQVGVVKALVGEVTATAADGSVRTIQVGDRVYANEVISTGASGAIEIEFADGSVMDLGRNSQAQLDSDVYDPSTAVNVASGDDVPEDVAAIQEALLAGEDPTENAEATAAGEGVEGTGGSEGSHQALFVDYLNPLGDVSAGFDTIGVANSYNLPEEDIIILEEPEVNGPPSVDPDPEDPPREPQAGDPSIITASVAVDEAALSFGNNSESNGEYSQGSFFVSDPDGLDDIASIQINGQEISIGLEITTDLGVMTITDYDEDTGQVTFDFELTDNVISEPAQDDGTNTELSAEIIEIVVTDSVGQQGTGTIVIDVQDDVPVVTINEQTKFVSLNVDETDGVQSGEDTDGVAKADFSGSFSTTIAYGADGPGDVKYSLSLSGSDIATGLYALDSLDTSDEDGDGIGQGQEIVLNISEDGLTVTGSVGETDYFTISINEDTGVVTFTQLNNIWHGDTDDHDDVESLILEADTLGVMQTVTDADGDSDSAVVDLSESVFSISDDGPNAQVDAEAEAAAQASPISLVVDETEGQQANPADNVSDRVSVAGFAQLFAEVTANVDGDGDYGTDGAGSIAYSLNLVDTTSGDTVTGVRSGLFALDNTDTDSTDGDGYGQGEEILLSVADNGDIIGSIGDDVYFTISVHADTGDVTFSQSGEFNIWHGDDTDNNDAESLALEALQESDVAIRLTQEVTDADGDSDTASVDLVSSADGEGVADFSVLDDGPNAEVNAEAEAAAQASPISLVVDETDGQQANPADNVSDRVSTASFAQLFAEVTADVDGDGDYGTDGAGSISYSLNLVETTSGDTVSGVSSGLYALDSSDTDSTDGDGYGQGEEILLSVADNGDIIGSIGDDVYFTISVDADTGDVTFTQSGEFNIWHGDDTDNNDAESLALEALQESDVAIRLTQEVTDADGDTDTASVDLVSSAEGEGVADFSVLDDGPNAQVDAEAEAAAQASPISLVVDETEGQQANPADNVSDRVSVAGFAQLFAEVTADVDGDGDYGTDGAGSIAYSLNLVETTSGDTVSGVSSGLYALDSSDTDSTDGDGYGQGEDILLSVADNGDIIGSIGDDVYFTISVDEDTGDVTFTQSGEFNIWHGDDTDNNDAESLALEALQASDVAIRLTQEVTDADGDTDTASVDLVSSAEGEGVADFSVLDDGPNAQVDAEAEAAAQASPISLVVDETDGQQANPADNVSDRVSVAGFAQLFAEVTADVDGDGDYGTDGAGSISYSLNLVETTSGDTVSGVSSGLYALDSSDTDSTDGDGYGQGEEILLSVADNGDIIGSIGDDVYFTISVDEDTGDVTFTQSGEFNIWHGDDTDNNDAESLALEALQASDVAIRLTQEVTDADGDTDTASVDLVSSAEGEGVADFSVLDDGPQASNDVDNVAEGVGNIADGNVFSGVGGTDENTTDGVADSLGTDGGNANAVVSGIYFGDENAVDPDVTAVPEAGTTISGQYGDLTIYGNGDYSYVLTAGSVPAGATETFTYALTDADGDSDLAELTISVVQDLNSPVVTGDQLDVYEDGLADGLQHGPDSESADGSFVINANGEGFTLTLSGDDGDLTDPVVGDILSTTKGDLEITDIQQNGDQITYSYTYTLTDNQDHPDGNGENQLTADGIDDSIDIQVTDATGDTNQTPGSIDITIIDDVPINNSETIEAFLVHEDALADGNSEAPSQTAIASITAADIASLVVEGADAPVTITLNTATDGEGSIDGTDTGLTQDGVSIVWNVNGDVLEGVVAGTDPAEVVFTLTANDSDDDFTFTLLDNIDHDDDADLTTGEGDAFTESLSLDGAFVATDTDGDSVVVDAGAAVTIENDVPVVETPDATQLDLESPLVLDESALPDAGDGVYSISINVAAAFAALGGASVGADEPGVISYSVSLTGDSVGSGLYIIDDTDTDVAAVDGDGYGQGDEIMLVDNGDGTVSGMVGTLEVFTLSVDANGELTFAYSDQADPANIWHPINNLNPEDPASFDEQAVLQTELAGQLVVTQSVTDSDGDTVTSSGLDIGTGEFFAIEDDGPVSVITPDSGAVINSAGSTFTGQLDIDGEIDDNTGTDLQGTVRFTVEDGTPVEGSFAGDPSEQLTSGGMPIFYYTVDNVLYGSTTEPDSWDGTTPTDVVFTVTLNVDDQGPDSYDFELISKIDAQREEFTVQGNEDYNFVGGNTDYIYFDIADSAPTPDILVTPLAVDTTGADPTFDTTVSGTMNANAAQAGTNNGPTVQYEAGIRVNYVSGIGGNPGSGNPGYSEPEDHSFDSYETINGGAATFVMKSGDLASVRMAAYNEDPLNDGDANTGEPDGLGGGDEYVDTSDTIIAASYIVITDDLGNNYVVEVGDVTLDAAYAVIGTDYVVTFNSDGSVDVSGVSDGTRLALFTEGDGYNAIEFVHLGDDDFALGGFGATVPGEEQELTFDTFPLELVDADGDTIEVDPIDLTLTPESLSAEVSEDSLVPDGIPEEGELGTVDQGTINMLAFGDAVLALTLPTAELTSNGEPITWALSDSDTVLIGSANGETVIVITLSDEDTGDALENYTVELFGPVDHPNPSIEDQLSFDVTITGGTEQVDLTVYINDDSPEVPQAVKVEVVETTASEVAPQGPVVGVAEEGGLLNLVGVEALDLISSSRQQLFTASDVNNDITSVTINYTALVSVGTVLGNILGSVIDIVGINALLDAGGGQVWTYDAALAEELGITVTPVSDDGLLGVVGPSYSLVITATDGGELDNLQLNNFLSTVALDDGLNLTSILTDPLADVGALLGLSLSEEQLAALRAEILSQMSIQAQDLEGFTAEQNLSQLVDADLALLDEANLSNTPTAGDDFLYGDAGDNPLSGGQGNDILRGLSGDDTLEGNEGNDILIGGTGSDILIGGTGVDVFRWEQGDADGSTDTISDFNMADDDVIDVSGLITADPVEGSLASSLANYMSFSLVGSDTFLTISGTGGADQVIQFTNVDLTALGADDEAIIQALLDGAHLLAPQSFIESAGVADAQITGNIFDTDADADIEPDAGFGFGADGGYVQSVTVSGVTFNYDGSVISVDGTDPAVTGFDADAGVLTIYTAKGETITVDMNTGDYSYMTTGQISETVAGEQAPTVGVAETGGLLGLVGIEALNLVDLPQNQIFSASDVNNNIEQVVIRYDALLSLGEVLVYSEEVATELGLDVTLVDGVMTITSADPAHPEIDNVVINEFLATVALDGDLISNLIDALTADGGLLDVLLGDLLDVLDGLLGGIDNLVDLNAALLSEINIEATDTAGNSSGVKSLAQLLDADVDLLDSGDNTPSIILGDDTDNAGLDGTGEGERIYGLDGNDTINAGGGNDLVRGGLGNDTISGDAGNDLLIGGQGTDALTGGTGNDVFRWELGDADGSTDIVTDFSIAALTANGDVIDLSNVLQGEARVGDSSLNLTNFMTFSFDGSDTTLSISSDGSGVIDLTIVFQGVDFTSLGDTDEAIIEALLESGQLIVDGAQADQSYEGTETQVDFVVVDNDGDTANTSVIFDQSNIEFEGQPNVAPEVDVDGEGLLGLLGAEALGLIEFGTNQTFKAFDRDNNITRVDINYSAVVGALGGFTLSYSLAAAEAFGLEVTAADGTALSLLGDTVTLADYSGIVITSADGGTIDNYELNAFLATVEIRDGSDQLLGLNDLSADVLNEATITAVDEYGLSDTDTLANLAEAEVEPDVAASINVVADVDVDVEGVATISADAEVDASLVLGGADDETLIGSDQDDVLFGGEGNDTLVGGQGNDILIGGEDADIFLWQSGDEGTEAEPAVDLVVDFNAGEGDVLDVSDLLSGIDAEADIADYIEVTYDAASDQTQIDVFTAGDETMTSPTQTIMVNGQLDQQSIDNLLNSGITNIDNS